MGMSEKKELSLSHTTTNLRELLCVVVNDKDSVQKGKRSPSSVGGSPSASSFPKLFPSFALGGKARTSGMGGTSGGG